MAKYAKSIRVLFILGLFAPLFSYAAGPKAALFLTPQSGSFLVGSTFDLSVVIDTKGANINTIEVELSFPADKVQLASPSVGKSIIQLWPAPPLFSNREGKVYFVGGIPSPGINTSQGVVLTLTFRVISPGEGEIKFLEKTSVLANDGTGANILGQKPSAFFRFSFPPPQGPAISSSTHPDQERWYKDSNPVFLWPKNQFSETYSFSIDHDPTGFPDASAESSSPTTFFQNLENGIWYFHLRERAGGVWGGVSHYAAKIDNEPPASFKISASPSKRTTNRNPIFRFFTTDIWSGFDHFEMKIVPLSKEEAGEALFFEASSPYQAINLEPGRYQIIVRALDKAGNSRDEAITVNIAGTVSQFLSPEGIDLIFVFLPWSQMVFGTAIILFICILILWILWKKHQHHLYHAFGEDIKNLFKFFKRKDKI